MSKYMERKIRSLNCMGRNRNYGSIESIDTVDQCDNNQQQNNKNRIGLVKSLSFLKKHSSRTKSIHLPEENMKTEKSHLISGNKIKYSTLINEDCDNKINSSKDSFKIKKTVRFMENLNDEKTNGKNSMKKNKKKKSLLKKTGLLIVRSCRLMTYGAPYMPPNFNYNDRYTRDYRNFDYETGQYDYTNHYMPYNEYGPAIYF